MFHRFLLLLALSVLLGFSTSIQAKGKTIKVTPKTGIQAALDKAEPGDVIVLAPGTYYETRLCGVAVSGAVCRTVVRTATRHSPPSSRPCMSIGTSTSSISGRAPLITVGVVCAQPSSVLCGMIEWKTENN